MTHAFKDHFSGHAQAYAAHRPTYPATLADHLAALAPRRDAAWDCGCGSGQLTTLLGDRFARVTGTDASPQQLAQARPHARVAYRCAPAEASGLEAGSMDLIVAAQAAHWFDMQRFNAEVHRVAAPGAAVALVTYELHEIAPELDPLIRHFFAEVAGPYWPPERRHIEAGYATLAFPFEPLPPPSPPLDIRLSWDAEAYLAYLGTWSATRRLVASEGPEAFARFAVALREAWGDTALPRLIRWPLVVRAGRVG